MNSTQERPLSPHLTIWKWGPHMLVSILHRVTGGALTVVGLPVLAWWLTAIAGGQDSYAVFASFIGWERFGISWVQLALFGLTWAFWQHCFSGLRHLVLDTGAGYELKVNRFWAWLTIPASFFVTCLTWYILKGVGQ